MSGTKDKVKGMANEAVGNIKQGVGKATDNDRLRAEGKAQELKGEAQQTVGKVKDAVKKPWPAYLPDDGHLRMAVFLSGERESRPCRRGLLDCFVTFPTSTRE